MSEQHLAAMANLDIGFRSSFKVKYGLFTRTFNCILLLTKAGKFVFFIYPILIFHEQSLITVVF